MSSSPLHDGGKFITDNPVHSPGAAKSTVVMSVASGYLNDGEMLGIGHAMGPKNMRLIIIPDDFKDLATEEEKWFGKKWGIRKISPDDMAKHAATAALPLEQPTPKVGARRRSIQGQSSPNEKA
ncbi:hypothetical protein F4679DRAFT_590613 [Xylaria curta]|nr:hypothetical protein F4679DRAFT_590613 [Xylaria curta]